MNRPKLDPKLCSKTVFAGGWHGHQCNRKAILQEPESSKYSDGKIKGWCKQHAPSSVSARCKKRNDRWDKMRKGQERVWALDAIRDKISDAAIEAYKVKNDQVDYEVTDLKRQEATEALDDAIEEYLKLSES